MRPRLFALAAVALALAAAALWRLAERRDAARRRDAAERAAPLAAAVERCLFGGDVVPRDERQLAARFRRVALHPRTREGWPRDCAPHARRMADALAGVDGGPFPVAAERATALAAALSADALAAAVRSLREGDGDAHLTDWLPALRAMTTAVAALPPTRAPRVGPAAHVEPLRPLEGDVLPVSIAPGSIVAGWGHAAGTLNVFFIEPTRERVFCRSRDRGASLACRRFGPEGTPRYLVGGDGPEALLLAGTAPAEPALLVTPEEPERPVFAPALPLVPSLAARVVGGALHAVVDDRGASALARCPRGGACSRAPLGAPSQREAVVLAPDAGNVWWLGVGGEAPSLSLDARRVAADAGAPGEVVHVAPLRTTAALFASCHAPGVAYAAAVDGAVARLVAVEAGGAPRELGALGAIDLPFDLACDEAGATVAGATRAQSCARAVGCSAPLALDSPRRFARVGGELVAAHLTRDGGDGVRVRHGAPERLAEARAFAVDDDAAHGGVSARALWLFAAGERLVLFASGATTAVLWSDDRGESWRPSREAGDAAPRPARLGSMRP